MSAIGLIAGALGGGAQAVGQIAQQQLDINDKQAMARYNADIDMEKATAAARLQQSIGRENKLWDVDQTSGGYADLARQGKVADTTATGTAETGVLTDRATAQEQAKLDFYTANQPALDAQAKSAANNKESDSRQELERAQAGYFRDVKGQNIGKTERMSEADKALLMGSITAVDHAEAAYTKALHDVTGQDPTTDAAVKYTNDRLMQARQQLTKTRLKLGDLTPADLADSILSRAKTSQEALGELNRLNTSFGAKVSDEVASAVQADDRWNAFKTAPPPAPAAPAGILATARNALTPDQPKIGDTRQIAVGRGMGTKTQVYSRMGRSGSSTGWVDQ